MSNNLNHTLYSNYPVDAHITIHYQNIKNTANVNDTADGDDKKNESESSISSLTSLSSTPTMLPVSISPSLYIIETVLNISNQYADDTDRNHNYNYIPKTKKYPNLTDFEQCRNITNSIQSNYIFNSNGATTPTDTHDPIIKPLIRRFTEPIYIDRDMIDSLTESSANDINDQNYSPHIPCTRHHHRRNTTAIKFNKPLYKEFLANK